MPFKYITDIDSTSTLARCILTIFNFVHVDSDKKKFYYVNTFYKIVLQNKFTKGNEK
jgi:hypothetical protein